jgi:hypothetical protein
MELAGILLSIPLVLEWMFAPFNLWSGRTMDNFVRFTGFEPRVATRLFAPAKLCLAALLLVGIAIPAVSIAGAAGTVLISLVYLVRLVHPARLDPAGVTGFVIFGGLGASLLAVRLLG